MQQNFPTRPVIDKPIVFVMPVLRNGGAERVLSDIANGLARHGQNVKIISLYFESDSSHINANVPVHFLHDARESAQSGGHFFGKFVRRIRLLRRLRRALQQIPSNAIVIAVLEPSAQYLWFLRLVGGPRYLVSLHAHESTYINDQFTNPIRRWAEKTLLSLACRAADCVVLPSDGCRINLVEAFGVPGVKVRKIQNPVDLEKIRQLATLPVEKPEVPDGAVIFVHAARLVKQKNHRLLIDACDLLRAQYDNFVVWCCGEGPERGEIEAWILKAGLQDHVRLLGHLDNPYALMAKARGVLLTSEYESFGLVLVEAMICGAPPIATNCYSGPDEVLRDGAGLLVPNNQPIEFSQAMLHLIQDEVLHADFRAYGSLRAQDYAVDNIISHWLLLLQDERS